MRRATLCEYRSAGQGWARPWLLASALWLVPAPAVADFFVVEEGSAELSRYDTSTRGVTLLGPQLGRPTDVLVRQDDDVLVTDRLDDDPSTGALLVLDRDADFAAAETVALPFAPVAMSLDVDGDVYLASAEDGVWKLEADDGSLSLVASMSGPLTGLALHGDHLYALSSGVGAGLLRIDPQDLDPENNFELVHGFEGGRGLFVHEGVAYAGTDDAGGTLRRFFGLDPADTLALETLPSVGPVSAFGVDPWGLLYATVPTDPGRLGRLHPQNWFGWGVFHESDQLMQPTAIAWDPVCVERDFDSDGSTTCGGDCDDSDSSRHPGAVEWCNFLDDDCNGDLPDEERDTDFDGHTGCIDDCGPDDPSIHPGAPEVCGDGLDQNCDGGDLPGDADMDGSWSVPCGGKDCDDGDDAIHPGAKEACGDGVDQDCDGQDGGVDGDGDGFVAWDCGGDDCDDQDPQTNPGAVDVCGDDKDQDCDGDAQQGDADGDGEPGPECGGADCDDLDGQVSPGAPEECNGLDDDCDGRVDESGDDLDADACVDEIAMGFRVTCSSVSPSPTRSFWLLLLGSLALARRRRRASAGVLLCLLLCPALAAAQDAPAATDAPQPSLTPPIASQAPSPEDAAVAAQEVHQTWCAATEGKNTTTAATALAEVSAVYVQVSASFDASDADYLLYWRGLLALCLDQAERAREDFEAFVARPGVKEQFGGLVRSAQRHTTRHERVVQAALSGRLDPNPFPTLSLSLSGGIQGVTGQGEGQVYGVTVLDWSGRLVGALRLAGTARLAVSGFNRDTQGRDLEPREVSVYPEGGVGLVLRAHGPVRPSIAVLLHVAGNTAVPELGTFFVGPALRFAVDFPFGRLAPVGLRAAFEGSLLVSELRPVIPLRLSLGVVAAFGAPATQN